MEVISQRDYPLERNGPYVFFLFFPPLELFLPCLYSELNRKAKSVKNYKAKIELLGSYDPQKQHIIKDPYYVSLQVKCFDAQVKQFPFL